jgi:hypothetical protein
MTIFFVSKGVVYQKLSTRCEFWENWHSERHNFLKGINEISPVFPKFSPNLDKFGTVYIHKNIFIYCGFCEKWWCSENHTLPCFPHQWEMYIDFLDDFVEWKTAKLCCYTSCWLTLSVVCADHTQEASEMFLITQENDCKHTYILHYPFQSNVKNLTKCVFHIFCPYL